MKVYLYMENEKNVGLRILPTSSILNLIDQESVQMTQDDKIDSLKHLLDLDDMGTIKTLANTE